MSLTFDTFKAAFPTPTEVKNLGGRSQFTICQQGEGVSITNSAQKVTVVDADFFASVLERMNSLDVSARENAGEYTHPKWQDCPNRNGAPYVAAAIKSIS